ncbi:MAG: hypothetical protein A2X82_01485 [Geobacteraceae bacterium GWC2_55_20]|nr:MAG: hypothetical protein A2X82_01485 [Geobacteraceae bacterium GWC2_55_20]OGU24831.1 MAG: hypothetical protein A2X85_00515 [Geobacteraceae bacterium GWF2_54_21]HBA72274.1 hypothetical protein [Geobacter sp.]HCE67617.1 hypothetical protein [Geobacter sp.]
MKFNTRVVCAVLAPMLLTASGQALAASTRDGSVDALLELLSVKGVITTEESAGLRGKSDSPTGSGFKAVIELLQRKGTITGEEADKLLRRELAGSGQEQPQKDPEVTEAKEKSVEPAMEANAKLPEKEIRPVLEVLREQGVLGIDETEQIKERIGKKWSTADEDDFIAMEDQEIEYNRSSLPKEGLLANIVKLQHQALITADEAERIRDRFLRKLSLERVTDAIGDNLQRDMRVEVAGRILPIPEWTRRIKLNGDLRLRYRADLFDKNNGESWRTDTNTLTKANSTVDRYYAQVRARLGLKVKVNDQLEAGIRLATGNTSNPVSTNSTMGDSLNKKNFLLDQAYLKWKPIPEFTVWGGRFENPWFGTDLVWDQDLNFDGLAMSWKPDLGGGASLFFTAGAFPIEEMEMKSHDKWLFGGQVGVNYKYRDKLTATLAVAYYHFDNITGKSIENLKGDTDWSRPKFQQKGNTPFYLDPNDNPSFVGGGSSYLGYAAEFRELNISTKIDYAIDENYQVTLIGDYVNNLGYNRADVDARVGQAMMKETEGYQVGISVGNREISALMDWKVMLNYKYLEADAVVDGFTESDFHLGGTNAKGWIIGVDLGLAKNVWMTTRWFTANEISGVPLAIDVFQLNLNAKF